MFQNRYKSIVSEEDPYLLELVRYIHLNPPRASLIGDLGELDGILGAATRSCEEETRVWQERDYVLQQFPPPEKRRRFAPT